MELAEFCSSSRVIIVAGKGGVGKTTTAAALGVAAARAGRRALIVELEGKSGLAAAFNTSAFDREVYPGVEVLGLAPDAALIEYLEDHGFGRISRRLTTTGALDVISTAVPGMKDILVLGKVKALQRQRVADVIIVDGPAAGHAVTFLLSPKGLLDAVRVGPVLNQAAEVTDMLTDPERAQVLLVTLPEETPVNETLETAEAFTSTIGLALGPLIVNAVYPDRPFDGATQADRIRDDAGRAGIFVPQSEVEHLARAAEFVARRRDLQRVQIERLAAAFDLPLIELPFLFSSDLGPGELEVLADALSAGMRDVPVAT